jgi:D-alanyl-lipoteichoic acid acyltransferase DltB (MBOAT superfamily)
LGVLAFFKYNNFFIDSAQIFTLNSGVDLSFLKHDFLLPVGISFYTFQTLSYTIDLYRRHIPCEHSFIKFAVFVSFFPQLVAGPIVRASHFLPQLHQQPNVTNKSFESGLLLVFRGLFKKIIIADLLATLAVDDVFANPSMYSSLDLLLALYGYSFQIYNDFSGYSDIAIGTARMLGFNLPDNFNRPYMAQNVREFWTRWHISLSSWLRDYLYIPLGGNRGKPGRVKFNLMLTMLLGGLWHGAALNFVLWGGWHGILLILSRNTKKIPDNATKIYRIILNRFICFHLIAFSWLLFRIDSTDKLIAYLSGMSKLTFSSEIQPLYYLILCATFIFHYFPRATLEQVFDKYLVLPNYAQALVYSALLILFIGVSSDIPQFIYFQF